MDRPTLLFVSLLAPVGCGFGVLDDLQNVPVCDSHGHTDPECADKHHGSSGSGDTSGPPTSGANGGNGDEGIATTTESTEAISDSGTPEDGTSEGTSTTPTSGAPPAVAPTIVDVEVDPDMLTAAASIAVEVEALNAAAVTMALDGAAPVPLVASGGNFYQGSIEILGASMNGHHTLVFAASNDGLVDEEEASFDVDAPSPGLNIWVKTNAVPASQTQAIAVDLGSNAYEVGTSGDGDGARLVVSKRDVSGTPAWPGMWLTYNDGPSWGEDVAVGPDGKIYVLGSYADENKHTRWWLFTLDPGAGIVVGEPKVGEIGETAHGLSVADNGDIAIVAHVTVWGQQQTNDVQTRVWFFPKEGVQFNQDWGYSPDDQKNLFAEMPEDVLLAGERIYVTGSAEGVHQDGGDMIVRKRTFVIEMNHKGEVVREYVAANTPYARSGGAALAIDGEGGVVAVGWACDDVCVQVGEIQWFHGDGELMPYARQVEVGEQGSARAYDVAYNPAGYNAVVSAARMGVGFNFGVRVTGRRADNLNPVLKYVLDTQELEMGLAVAVGPNGYIWFGGARVIQGVALAFAGRNHG